MNKFRNNISVPKIFSSNITRLSKPIVASALLLSSNSVFAQCSIDTDIANGFTEIGDVQLTPVTSDADNNDGENDGALLFDGESAVVGQGGAYAFECDAIEGETLDISSHVYNPNASYVALKVVLYNKTDDVELASTANLALTSSTPVKEFTLSYNIQDTDLADELELRYIRVDDGNTARNFAVDNATINGQALLMQAYVPPPMHVCFMESQNQIGFAPIGDVSTSAVTDDADNTDGLGDGAFLFNGQSQVEGQGAAYLFDCPMSAEQNIAVSSYVYNTRSSYVALKVALHNVTDDVELASTASSIITSADPAVNFSFNYTTQATDEGDELEVRYIRTDNGHTARDFSVDNISINSSPLKLVKAPPPPNPACTMAIDYDTDIPLTTATSGQIAQIDNIYQTLSDTYLGTEETIDFAELQLDLDEALTAYDNLNIVIADMEIDDEIVTEIQGENITYGEAGKMLRAFSRHLKLVAPTDTDIAEKASNIVWLTSRKVCTLDITRDYNSYSYREFARNTIHLKDYLSDNIKDRFGFTLSVQSEDFSNFWGEYAARNGYNTDWMFNMGDTLALFGLWKDVTTDDERVQWLKGAKRFVERFLDYSEATNDGIKPDGSAFHHWTAYDGYMYSLRTVINLIHALEDTDFQINADAYLRLRDTVYAQRMKSNDSGIVALSTTGRNPHIKRISTLPTHLKKLAISGGKILGLDSADPILAGYYNRTIGVDADFNYDKVAKFENGFFQFNHGNAGVLRHRSKKGDWLAVMNGFTDNMWGAELYPSENRYGRYQSYGALEIIYSGDDSVGNNGFDVDTWNWNYNPGATTIVLPWDKLHGERSRIDGHQDKRFAGSLAFKNRGNRQGVLEETHGKYGIFAMDFQERELGGGFGIVHGPNTHNTTFTFKKSNFAFSDMIVSLGSDITNDDVVNPTVTTLYQRLATDNSSVIVDKHTYGDLGATSFAESENHWLIDDYQTGFYLAAGSGELKVWKGNQQTPNEDQIWPVDISQNPIDQYTIGYLDHGTAPENNGYEYVTVPNANAFQMDTLAKDKPYVVHEKTSQRHVIEHLARKIWGYAFFEAAEDMAHSNSILKATDTASLVMLKHAKRNKVELSVTDPDLGFISRGSDPVAPRTVSLTLHGNWLLKEEYPRATLVSSNTAETVIEFSIVDGLPVEVKLIAVE
ncbi:polysaccharide lyase family 8 super-sandwich domain-containing protein [Thalassotalea sp. ND16A]|uniref:polysaccharide lyase family 8 super-sandwich domain-containing protein n=1 Tax=Thalassotalea sp. ND16A TaxID=1535422 RepID=UPI00051A703D|nr:polysaccharide lyase family 8 super-sandwich domain-containing protein [Thalassotalea sp. ND16A]KGJ95064.1 Chondroitin-sulfate-ABC endolyase [Thalassotalea sp. ND16A]